MYDMIEPRKEVTNKARFLRWELGDEVVDKLTFDERLFMYAYLMAKRTFTLRIKVTPDNMSRYLAECNKYPDAEGIEDVCYQILTNENEELEGCYHWLFDGINWERAARSFMWRERNYNKYVRVSYKDELGTFDGVVSIFDPLFN